MTHLLVHPPLHRSENIRIRSKKPSTNDSSCRPIARSADEASHFSEDESHEIIEFIQRLTCENQIAHRFSLPISPTDEQINEENHLDHQCDQIEPVTNNETSTR